MYAFGLEECNERDRALQLVQDSHAVWAIHAHAHILEEYTRVEQGIELLTRTRSSWTESVVASHIHWHL